MSPATTTRRTIDSSKAFDVFLAAKSEIDTMRERLTALSADHLIATSTRSIGAKSAA
jgi:hypothetical protein